MSRFSITDLPLDGLKLVERKSIGDTRGFITRIFSREEMAESGWVNPIAQINHSYTANLGTVRGMHFQRQPFPEMKLVSCIRGEVWDVAVDVRKDSPTFLQWHAERLSAENGRALLIPIGFAHGFQALSDDVELIYCHSECYRPEVEAGINPRDGRLSITWPREITNLSTRDADRPMIDAGNEEVFL